MFFGVLIANETFKYVVPFISVDGVEVSEQSLPSSAIRNRCLPRDTSRPSSVDTSGVSIGTLVQPSESTGGDHPFRRLLVRHGTLGGVTPYV
ncbi:hypothetical protein HOLleu_05578 [Holothuria leucospilota]|uniref:Uncharacterized protein n=1 Tax=Holothuria leucospilota TaxID=206669 RepID=A0A9Q1CLC4_HOLLE|nr:hypothetical protein HOLleu_05578 [Holothuria leucospilota]